MITVVVVMVCSGMMSMVMLCSGNVGRSNAMWCVWEDVMLCGWCSIEG